MADHQHFANDVGAMALRQPARFAKLALRLPDTAPPEYLRRIIRAFEQKDSPDVLTKAKEQNKDHPDRIPGLEQELASWRAATRKEIEAIITKVGFPQDRETAKAICSLIDKRDDIKWSRSTIDLIARVATTHSDPAPDEFASGQYDETDRSKVIPDVANSSLNCVRGTAALAMKDLLFADQKLYDDLKDSIVALTQDANVAVRAATIAACVPILNINRYEAVDHFLAICNTDDDRIFESHYLDSFLRYALSSHHERLIPVIERMARSEIDEVAKRGAACVAAAWLYNGSCEEMLGICRTGSQPQRHGVAEVAGQSSWENETAEGRIELLPAFFDDEDKNVRNDTSRVFWNDEPWQDDRLIDLAGRFIESRAFAEDPTPIIHGLVDVKGSILRYAAVIHAIADKIAGPLAEAAKDMNQGTAADVPDLFKLILRLHQQAQDNRQRDVQAACLDRWDALLRAGVGGYRETETLLDSIDR